ncbi:MAG: NrdH-redoxin [Candidatus Buchananbacteria bacterium]|nr:NrdH-redoxin [Candidatus Buchananbacteria bacterium]
MSNVTIYTTPTCAYCHAAKQYFSDNKVEYKEIDAAADINAAKEMVEKTGQMGVPVIIVEKDGQENIIIGFDKPKLASLLGIA